MLSGAAGTGGGTGRAGDGRLSGGHGDAVADRYGDADLLGQGHGAAGPGGVGDAGDAGRTLAGDIYGADRGGGRQSHRGRDVDTLGADFIAAADRRAGVFRLGRAGQYGFMLVSFVNTQSDPSFPREYIR